MAWNGYFELDGTEIINGPRTEAYAAAAGKSWFRPTFNMPELAVVLEQSDYTTPVMDGAAWVDPDVPESEDFYGFFPLDVSGIEDSTRQSTVTESTDDGGSPGRLRHGTRSVVFNGLLLAGSEAAAEYGVRWLKRALLGKVCSDTLATKNSLGADLTYFASAPDPAPQPDLQDAFLDGGSPTQGPDYIPGEYDITKVVPIHDLLRLLRRVVVNNGPTVTSRRTMSCGGAVWTVTFTAVAGSPFEFGAERPIIQGYMDAAVTDPWVPGTTEGYFDTAPFTWTEVECGTDQWEPIYDPLCAALVVPPTPPSIPLGCFTPPSTWDRRKIEIAPENVPLWGQVVPVVTAHAATEVRNVRIRFYEDPNGTVDPSATPCDFIGDAVLSFIPAGGSLVFDAALEQVYVVTQLGQKRRADSLVFSTDGKPFEWPSMTCGYGYILTIDVPQGGTVPTIDVSLVPRAV